MSLIRLVTWLLLLGVGLTACAHRERDFIPADGDECPRGGICKVRVEVLTQGTGCSVRLGNARQKNLYMPPGDLDVVIQWHLDRAAEQNYEFRNDSIYLKTGTTDQFQLAGALARGKKFMIVNANEKTESFEYNIKVYRKQGGPCVVLDPFIHNIN